MSEQKKYDGTDGQKSVDAGTYTLDGREFSGPELLAKWEVEYGDRIRRYIRRHIPNKLQGRLDEADIAQEVWIDVHKRLHNFFEPEYSDEDPFNWIMFIVRQTTTTIIRKNAAGKRDINAEGPTLDWQSSDRNEDYADAMHPASSDLGPLQHAQRSELAEIVHSCIGELNDIDQEILTLRGLQQLSNVEAAEVLGVNSSAASVRFLRAGRRLKQQIEPNDELSL